MKPKDRYVLLSVLNLLNVYSWRFFSCASEFNHSFPLQNFPMYLPLALSLLRHILKRYNRWENLSYFRASSEKERRLSILKVEQRNLRNETNLLYHRSEQNFRSHLLEIENDCLIWISQFDIPLWQKCLWEVTEVPGRSVDYGVCCEKITCNWQVQISLGTPSGR
jgi:hypothetical protein